MNGSDGNGDADSNSSHDDGGNITNKYIYGNTPYNHEFSLFTRNSSGFGHAMECIFQSKCHRLVTVTFAYP